LLIKQLICKGENEDEKGNDEDGEDEKGNDEDEYGGLQLNNLLFTD
jgi:hypothetical protein